MVFTLTETQASSVFRSMALIRAIELGIAERYSSGKMRCPTHLSLGQEAVPAILSLFLRKDDYAVSSHRSHAHYLGKGGDAFRMLAEIYGLEEGCSGGRGGSMHLVDSTVGFMGSSAIVGNSIPVGTGLGQALKLNSKDSISVVYLGDAATEEGVFFESINYAATAKLPVLFVCENNDYSVYSDLRMRQPKGRRISEMVTGLGIHSVSLSDEDPSALVSGLQEAIKVCRGGRLPAFAEVKTTRFLEHCGPNDDSHLNYRDAGILEKAKKSHVFEKFREAMETVGIDAKALENEINLEVTKLFETIEDLHLSKSVAFKHA